jgi:hypothetical protein
MPAQDSSLRGVGVTSVSDMETDFDLVRDHLDGIYEVKFGASFGVTTWNVEWAPARRREAISARIARYCSDIFVVTEGDPGVLPTTGHMVLGQSNWGYGASEPRQRKIILWSAAPLADVDTLGSHDLPPGRFAAGTLMLPAGPVRIVGICIPWHNAHVATGRGDSKPWDEHLAFLEALRPVLDQSREAMPVCVLGDFNQRIPSSWVPRRARAALEATFGDFTIVTAGDILPGLAERAVDHIALSAGLRATGVAGRDCLDEAIDGRPPRRLSDHHLVSCMVQLEENS